MNFYSLFEEKESSVTESKQEIPQERKNSEGMLFPFLERILLIDYLVEEHETMDDTPDVRLMRTKSTSNVEQQSPQQKWGSLFKMFKEWKHQTTVAEGARM